MGNDGHAQPSGRGGTVAPGALRGEDPQDPPPPPPGGKPRWTTKPDLQVAPAGTPG